MKNMEKLSSPLAASIPGPLWLKKTAVSPLPHARTDLVHDCCLGVCTQIESCLRLCHAVCGRLNLVEIIIVQPLWIWFHLIQVSRPHKGISCAVRLGVEKCFHSCGHVRASQTCNKTEQEKSIICPVTESTPSCTMCLGYARANTSDTERELDSQRRRAWP